MVTQRDILDAAHRIKSTAHHTPVLTSHALDELTGVRLFFKCENFQKAGAFKFRGALNAVSLLDSHFKNAGVAAHSSGNHAQALALAAKLQGVKAHLVMPSNSSRVKVKAVENYGGIITFCEPTLEARESTLEKVLKTTGATEVHPYNNITIIAGQATAALELIEDTEKLDYLLVPVGGGGLTSGTALSAHFFSKRTKVIAVEPERANDAYQSFYARKFIPSVKPNTIADGLRTSLGSITFPIILEHVKDIVTVKENTIIEAMRLVWERMKIIIEPSSAVPLAALIENKITFSDNKPAIGIIISGGNVDFSEIKNYF